MLSTAQRERAAAFRPPPKLSVPEWADRYRRLSASVGAVGGPWLTSRVEVARGPMMAVTEPGVRKITAMTCTQLLKTSLLENVVGYFAHLDPCPMLLAQPKDEAVIAFSKERIVPLIEATPVLRDLVGGGDDTMTFKRFPGGYLALVSAGSPTNFAMRAIRIVLLDEIDKYETSKEGDPVWLAEERMATFTETSLSVRVCSPTLEETSRIYRSYMEGDQRRAYVPCPHCDHWQSLDFFKHVQWQKTDDGNHVPETAAIFCEECGSAWTEAERHKVITTPLGVRHQQTKPFTCCGVRQEPAKTRAWEWDDKALVGYAVCTECGKHAVPNKHASFTASKLLSPFMGMDDLVAKWFEAKDDLDTKQVFYNTQLGRPFKAQVAKEISSHWLAGRREVFPPKVPEDVLVLTAGVDVQTGSVTGTGRLEVEVVGWGLGEESWSLAAETFEGDPARAEVWDELDKFLLKPWQHTTGIEMQVFAACVDSGGNYTQDVYGFCRSRFGRNVWAIKGASDTGNAWSPVWPARAQEQKRKAYRVGFKPVVLGVNAAKEAVYQRLLIEERGPGYCHFPVDRDDEWLKQLTSETLIVERHNGRSRRRWVQPKHRTNEALDCRVYAYAALQGLYHTRRLSLPRLAEQLESMGREARQDALKRKRD